MIENEKPLLEKMELLMAQYAHDAWSRWMRHLFTKGRLNKNGSFTIKKDGVDRWQRQMNTNFYDLPDTEKESDFVSWEEVEKELETREFKIIPDDDVPSIAEEKN